MVKILGIQKPYCVRLRRKFGWPVDSESCAVFGVGVFGKAFYGNPEGAAADPSFGIYQQRKCKEGKISIRMKFYAPPYTRTEGQDVCRVNFADAVSAWQALTTEQKGVYNNRAKYKNYSGYNLYLREYLLSH